MNIDNKKRIINNALEIFLIKGIVNTSMKDIADNSDYDRRTLYRYFLSKEELVLEVIVNVLKKWNEFQLNTYKSLTGNGLKRFEDFYMILLKYNKEDMINLITEFDTIFNLNEFSKNTDLVELVDSYYTEAIFPVNLLKEILTLGLEDGSIKEIDVEEVALVIHNVIWGVVQKGASSNKSINNRLGINFKEITIKQIKMYIDLLGGK